METLPHNPERVRQLMVENYNAKHGVVDIRGVIDGLRQEKRNPAGEFVALLKERPPLGNPHYEALEGLRSLAWDGGLTKTQARFLFRATRRIAESPAAIYDDKIYYATISALQWSKKTASVILEWAEERLDKNDIPDAGWIACSAIGTVLERGNATVNPVLLDKLQPYIDGEANPNRKKQLQEVAEVYRKQVLSH